ncbi:MAG: RagB/SusD family nutrient uptake outer membrane protein [Bacteroides sp.]|nr:RagB/SusD family nutrient uptake outer membrane protein [Bacteroides sp.]
MKRSLYIISLIGTLLLCACDDFLNMQPTNSSNAEEAVTTLQEAEELMNGIMRLMTSSAYYGRRMLLYADAKGGDLTIYSAGRGEDALYTFTHSATSSTYFGMWETGYTLIAQVNNLLENIERLEAAGESGYSFIKGQALTLRALFHFDLVRLYGLPYGMDKSAYGIPVVTSTLAYDEKLTRHTVEETYAQVLRDLAAGEDLLKDNKNHKEGYVGYYANLGLQARVKLYMEEYEGALEAARTIIESGVYTLYAPGDWVESWSKQHQSESIFEIEIHPNEADLGTTSLGYYYMRRHHIGSVAGYFVASDYFLERLGEDEEDVRWGIMTYDESSQERLGCCYKYLGSVDVGGDGKDTPSAVNIKAIRLSEIYLIAAEAALNQTPSDPSLAAAYLNAIRQRAPHLEAATAATVSNEMILDERSKELYGEGHRFFDMIRLDRTIRYNDDLGGVPSQGRPETIDRTYGKIVLPISQDEINTNPAIGEQQNPGYL